MGWIVVAWRRRGIVLACALLAGGVAWGVSALLPKRFSARAGIAYTHLRPHAVFDEASPVQADGQARQRALHALVHDPSIARQVIQRCGADLDPQYHDASALMRCVEVDDSHGELFYIAVSSHDAELSASLANAWAEGYVTKANAVYGATTCTESLRALEQEVASQGKAYEEAQKALVACIDKSDEPMLTADREYYQVLIRKLAELTADHASEVVAEQLTGPREEPDASPSLWRELCDAGLRAQGFPTDLLRARNHHWKRPDHRAVAPISLESVVPLRRLDQGRLSQSAAELDARLAQVSAERERLTTARNTAFQLWSALLHRKAEAEIAARMVGAEVRLVLPAVPPDRPSLPRPAECGAAGALLGAIAVVLALSAAEASRRSRA